MRPSRTEVMRASILTASLFGLVMSIHPCPQKAVGPSTVKGLKAVPSTVFTTMKVLTYHTLPFGDAIWNPCKIIPKF